MRSVAVMNQKGGVGKTTTVANLASLLAEDYGKRVLLVDIDPQGSLTDSLGLDLDAGGRSVYDILIDHVPPGEVVRRAWGMDVLPASLDLAGAEVELASMTVREPRLRQALAGFAERYDILFIDCPPSLGLLTLSALVACNEVLVPMQAEYLSMRGLGQLAYTVESVRESLNPALRIQGIVFCQYNSQTRLSQEVADEVAGHFPGAVYRSRIRKNVRLAESPSHSMPTNHYDEACAGVRDYRCLAAEFLRRGGEDVPMPEDGFVARSAANPFEDGELPANLRTAE